MMMFPFPLPPHMMASEADVMVETGKVTASATEPLNDDEYDTASVRGGASSRQEGWMCGWGCCCHGRGLGVLLSTKLNCNKHWNIISRNVLYFLFSQSETKTMKNSCGLVQGTSVEREI